jgi:hypothetical protein
MSLTKIKLLEDYFNGLDFEYLEVDKENIEKIVMNDMCSIDIDDCTIYIGDINDENKRSIIDKYLDKIPEEWFSFTEWYNFKHNKIKVKGTRKNTDYQCTELVLALQYLGLTSTELDLIISYATDMFESNKLQCKRIILDRYISDLQYSFTKGTFSSSFITNFLNLNLDLSTIKCVYLTGKTCKDFPTLVELNKDYEQFKPNSDVFVEKYNGVIFGTSCKQKNNSPLSNKIAENYGTKEERLFLTNLRETLLHEGGITLDILKNSTKEQKKINEKKISQILCNKQCLGEPLQEYWKELTNHIIKYKDNFIDGVLHSISQSSYLPYDVYEYDGTTLVNTKDRMLDKEKCDIRVSEIFCYGKTKIRQACKIWFDFVCDDKVLYNLEVRFKNIWFNKGGSPQLFILKETEEDIKKYIQTRDKHLSNNS